jgi:uncharacterized protein (UPF0216 family)
MSRWLAMEISRINGGIVRDRKPLHELLMEQEPCATTRNGMPHYFKRDVIAALGRKLPRGIHARLRLPILFFLSPDVPDSCFCSDEAAVRALQVLGEISELRTVHGGRIWVARAIAYAVAEKYPTAVQVVIGA